MLFLIEVALSEQVGAKFNNLVQFGFFLTCKKSVKLNVCVALNAVLIAAYDLGCRQTSNYSCSKFTLCACM